jgi:hypothetical protein
VHECVRKQSHGSNFSASSDSESQSRVFLTCRRSDSRFELPTLAPAVTPSVLMAPSCRHRFTLGLLICGLCPQGVREQSPRSRPSLALTDARHNAEQHALRRGRTMCWKSDVMSCNGRCRLKVPVLAGGPLSFLGGEWRCEPSSGSVEELLARRVACVAYGSLFSSPMIPPHDQLSLDERTLGHTPEAAMGLALGTKRGLAR